MNPKSGPYPRLLCLKIELHKYCAILYIHKTYTYKFVIINKPKSEFLIRVWVNVRLGSCPRSTLKQISVRDFKKYEVESEQRCPNGGSEWLRVAITGNQNWVKFSISYIYIYMEIRLLLSM
jgi:hypothetical protein